MREDIDWPQRVVQSCHASIEAAHAFNLHTLSDHPSVIILGAKNEQKLHQVRKFLIENDIRHVHFYEADLDDELTALATEPLHGDRRQLFRKFQLLKSKPNTPQRESVKYAFQMDDGSYYRWAGDCGRSPHQTWCLEDANFVSDAGGFQGWTGGKVVEVRVGYRQKGGAQ